MSDVADVLARALAYKERRALPTRAVFALAPDPANCFGIAIIKMVSEQLVQAIAFGDPDGDPNIVTRWNPLSRETGEMDPFAAALDAYLQCVVARGELPRVWVPHSSALTIVELLGHRYRTNTKASAALQRMGWQCRALAEESKFQGQQIVAVAGDLLRAHVATGQLPIKDGHLGALLSWVTPTGGVDPAVEASGVLERPVDDRVERLRKLAKDRGGVGTPQQREIEKDLRAGALKEWKLLQDARRAFWGLGLRGGCPELDKLVETSRKRIFFQLTNNMNPGRHPHALARELDTHEYASALAEAAEVRGDLMKRERARRKGRAVRTEVTRVVQTRRNFKPCVLHLRVMQDVLRVREGSLLQVANGKLTARVEAMEQDASGETLLRVRVEDGVRSVPPLGVTVEWIDSIPRDMSFMATKVYGAMKAGNNPLSYGMDHEPKPATKPKRDLLAVAESLRRR
jgi:hypothetical protein